MRAALSLAARLAPGGEILVGHATHAPFKGFLGRGTLQQIIRDEQALFAATLKADLDRLAADLGEAAPRMEIQMAEGAVDDVIRNMIARRKPDLLAIGAHSRTGVAYAMLGSVAEGLLANPPTDILIGKAAGQG
jgi:nucleotide-binding universal stress UspA family protein